MDDWTVAAAQASESITGMSNGMPHVEEPQPPPPPDPIPPPPSVPPVGALEELEARTRLLQLTVAIVIGLELLAVALIAGIAARLFTEPK